MNESVKTSLPEIKRPEKSELLMPAGNLQKLKMAVLYGADAIYMGTPDMSLRTQSKFSLEDVVEGINYAHQHGVRVYLTLNLFAHNKDINKLPEYIETIRKVKPDGVIIADPGVFSFVRKEAPELELHISTQANVCSWLTVDHWKEQGASLVVMAREVSYEELSEVREKCPDIKLEAFVHGAMCMTYSGRCLLSNHMAERGANQGNCANSCRWNYKVHVKMKDGTNKELEINDQNKDMFEFMLEEGVRPGEMMPIQEDERGSYILNSKDLCLMPKLDDYLKIGVDSLKVEGRNKSQYYVAVVARAYRMAIDDYYKDPENWKPKAYMEELETVGSRGYSLAFHEGRLTNYAHNYENTRTLAEWEFAGLISEVRNDGFIIEVKNKIEAGDVLEFIPPKARNVVSLRIYEFEEAEYGTKYDSVHPGKKQKYKIPFSLFDHENIEYLKSEFPPLTVIRKEAPLTEEEWARVKLDRTAQRLELGKGRESAYDENLTKLQEEADKAKETQLLTRRPKSPRLGIEGCCGKGCNGCMIFWNDPEYAKARKLLAKKKQGEMFDKDMRDVNNG